MKAPPLSAAGLMGLAMLLYTAAAPAQVDLSGNWLPDDSWIQLIPNGPPAGDFLGVPLNKDGRAMAATADPAQESQELNRQCEPWSVNYFIDGPFGVVFEPVTDPHNGSNILAWHMSGTSDREPETIWLQGHAPPPARAPHTWAGFATGTWQGHTLYVSISHLKDGWLSRNGAPESNQETASMFLTREADLLTMTFIIHDPVYLAAPYARARTLKLSAASQTANITTENDCLPAEVIPGFSDGYHAARYLPGQNPTLAFMQQNYHIPPQVALGGPQQMYPEFRDQFSKQYTVPPGYCQVSCCAAPGLRGTSCPGAPGTSQPSTGAENDQRDR